MPISRLTALAIISTPPLLAALLALAAVLIRRRRHRERRDGLGTPTSIVCAPSALNTAVRGACPALGHYTPPAWLPGPHANTVGSALLRQNPRVAYRRTSLRLNDGGVLALDWPAPPLKRGQPVLVILHGLTGGSHERYVQWMVAAASLPTHSFGGFGCVVMNARGCAGSTLATPQSFSAAWTGDARATLAHVRSLVGPDTPICMIGFSLGAGVMVKLLAEDGAASPVAAAVSCAASLNHVLSTFTLESAFIRFTYNAMLGGSLRRFLARHASAASAELLATPHFLGRIDYTAAMAARTVREFDEAAIVPQFGYKACWHRRDEAAATTGTFDSSKAVIIPPGGGTVDTMCTGCDRFREFYYEDSSAGRRLGDVRVPLLFLHARDDPICSVAGLEESLGHVRTNPCLMAVITEEGGHVAWASDVGAAQLGGLQGRVYVPAAHPADVAAKAKYTTTGERARGVGAAGGSDGHSRPGPGFEAGVKGAGRKEARGVPSSPSPSSSSPSASSRWSWVKGAVSPSLPRLEWSWDNAAAVQYLTAVLEHRGVMWTRDMADAAPVIHIEDDAVEGEGEVALNHREVMRRD